MTGLSPESRMPDTHQPLVSPEWLAQHLHHPDLAILDVRLVAGEDWRAAFEAGHIPGATFTDYAKDGWRAAKGMAVGMLPDAAALSALFRSEEHTSELQSHSDLVCRLLLEKKKKKATHLIYLKKKHT